MWAFNAIIRGITFEMSQSMNTTQLMGNSNVNRFDGERGDITEAKDAGVPNFTDAKCGLCLPNQ